VFSSVLVLRIRGISLAHRKRAFKKNWKKNAAENTKCRGIKQSKLRNETKCSLLYVYSRHIQGIHGAREENKGGKER